MVRRAALLSSNAAHRFRTRRIDLRRNVHYRTDHQSVLAHSSWCTAVFVDMDQCASAIAP